MKEHNDQEAAISCPKCHSSRVARYGKTDAGLQKYRCLEGGCRRQFVPGSDHLLDPDKKAVALRLLEAGVAPAKIREGIPEISLRWLYELRKRLKRDQQR